MVSTLDPIYRLSYQSAQEFVQDELPARGLYAPVDPSRALFHVQQQSSYPPDGTVVIAQYPVTLSEGIHTRETHPNFVTSGCDDLLGLEDFTERQFQ